MAPSTCWLMLPPPDRPAEPTMKKKLNAHMAATAAMPRHGQSATETCTKDNEEHSLQTSLYKTYFCIQRKVLPVEECGWRRLLAAGSKTFPAGMPQLGLILHHADVLDRVEQHRCRTSTDVSKSMRSAN